MLGGVDRVGIVAAGHAGYSSISPGLSYKELTFAAATRAYGSVGIDPRRDIDSFVCASEDYLEGTSIFDAYAPDQIGGALRPVQTIAGDGLVALGAGVMLIRSGAARTVAVEAHSKVSDVASLDRIVAFALDPVYERPLGLHPVFVAGLEMCRYLEESGTTAGDCASVVATARRAALANPSAAFGAELSWQDVAGSPLVADPLRELDCARPADGAVVVVLAAEERARQLCRQPVWVDGIAWSTDAPSLSSRTWAQAEYARLAAERAYRQAGITDPSAQIDVAEIDDTYSYKHFQHLDALGFSGGVTTIKPSGGVTTIKPSGGVTTIKPSGGVTTIRPSGEGTAINPSGGVLGRGNLFVANGLAQVAELVAQLRGEAGACQVEGARCGVAQSWRGVPTTTGAVAVLSTVRV